MRNKLMLLCGSALAAAALIAPASAGAIFKAPPPPHCDPMACPDPLGDVRDALTCIALHDGAEITDLPTYCLTRR